MLKKALLSGSQKAYGPCKIKMKVRFKVDVNAVMTIYKIVITASASTSLKKKLYFPEVP